MSSDGRWSLGRSVRSPSLLLHAGQGVDRGRRHGAAAAPAVHGEVGDAVVERRRGPPWTRRRRRSRPAGRAPRPAGRHRRRAARAAGTAPSARCRRPPPRRRDRAASGRPPRPSGWSPPVAASSAMPGSSRVQRTALPAGRRARVMPLGHHHRVAEDRPRRRRERSRAAVTRSGDAATSGTRSTMPQAWIMRTTTGSRSAGTRDEVGLRPDGGERRVVDRGAVALVVEAPHGRAPAATNRPDGLGDEVDDAGRQAAALLAAGEVHACRDAGRAARVARRPRACRRDRARTPGNRRRPTRGSAGSPGRVISARSARADRGHRPRRADAAERQRPFGCRRRSTA